jgi:hypothetical protein
MTPAQLTQRQVAAIKHGAYVRSETGRQLRDHRARYARRKARALFPHLTAEDAVVVQAWAVQWIVCRDMADEMSRHRHAGEPIPQRLRDDVQKAIARLVEYDGELRRRDAENAAREGHDPDAFVARLVAEDGGKS